MTYSQIFDEFIVDKDKKDRGGFRECLFPGEIKGAADLSTGVVRLFGKDSLEQEFLSIDKFCEKFSIPLLPPIAAKPPTTDGEASSSFLETYTNASAFGDLGKNYCDAKGIKYEIAIRAGIKENIERSEVYIPIWDAGKTLHGVYRRTLAGEKMALPGSNTKLLYNPFGERRVGEATIIIEGQTDTLRMITELEGMEDNHFNVYGVFGNNFRKEWLRQLTGVDILIPDDDLGGTQLIESAIKVNPSFSVIELPWKQDQLGKDFTQWAGLNKFSTELYPILKQQKKSRRIYSSCDFMKEITKDRNYLIDNLFEQGEIAIIGGQMKSRKTWLVLDMIKSMTMGTNFVGIERFKGKGGTQVLLVEEEGTKEQLRDRLELVFGHTVPENLHIIFRSQLKLDKPADAAWLMETMINLKIGCVVLDPLQLFHSAVSENSATDFAPFWTNMKAIQARTEAAIAILHHFSASAKGSDKWGALRGTTRTGGEVDLGLFTDKFDDFNKLYIDGRNYHQTDDDPKYYTLAWDSSTATLKQRELPQAGTRAAFPYEFNNRKEWLLTDAAKHMNVTTTTINAWVKHYSEYYEKIQPGPGIPAKIIKLKDWTEDL